MAPTKPTIALVPGAWYCPAHYSLLTSSLEAHGYTIHGVSLPSCIDSPKNLDFTPDVAAVSSAIERIADQGHDVLLLMHSTGSIIGGDACRSLSKAARSEAGESGGIVSLFYMAALTPPEEASFASAMGGSLAPWVTISPDGISTIPSADADAVFYNDSPPHLIADQKALTNLFAKGVFFSDVMNAAWKDIPSVYLVCEKDLCIPAFVQEGFTKQGGGSFEAVRIDAGYMAWLSRTDEVVDAVKRAAGRQSSAEPRWYQDI